MADALPLTGPEDFCVKRLRTKILAAQHHLKEAAQVAEALPADVLNRAGLAEACALLSKRVDDLLRTAYPRIPAKEEPSDG